MGNYGFKVAKDGQDISSTDPTKLVMNSEWDAFKIWKENNITIPYTASSGSASGSVPHGLNFTPTFLAFAKLFGSNVFGVHNGQSTASDFIEFWAYSDATNLNFQIRVSSFSSQYASNVNFNIRYLIFADSAVSGATTTTIPTGNNYGIKIAKPGKDVSSQNIEDLVFTSEYPPMKVVLQQSTSISHTELTANTSYTLAHGMPFTPAFFLVADNGTSGATWYPGPYVFAGQPTPQYSCWTDPTNFNISFGGGAGSGVVDTWQFRIVIFGERGI